MTMSNLLSTNVVMSAQMKAAQTVLNLLLRRPHPLMQINSSCRTHHCNVLTLLKHRIYHQTIDRHDKEKTSPFALLEA